MLKYRLPSDPGVWVDLLDDDDVALMLEEWREHVDASGHSTAKLHLFVQVCVCVWGGGGRACVGGFRVCEGALSHLFVQVCGEGVVRVW